MEDGVQTFNAWNRDIASMSEFQRRSEICLNLHWTLGFKVEPHGAVILLWLDHLLKCRFAEVVRENTLLSFGKSE